MDPLETAFELITLRRRADALDIVAKLVDDLLIERKFKEATVVMSRVVCAVQKGKLPISAGLLVIVLARPWREFLEGAYDFLFAALFFDYERQEGSIAAHKALDGLQ